MGNPYNTADQTMIAIQKKIKKSTLKGWNKTDGEGTSLRGYLYATFDQLVAVFGKPHQTHTDKSKAVWGFVNAKDPNKIFTIYDYDERGNVKDVTEWHIGGMTINGIDVLNALDLVHDFLPNCEITEAGIGLPVRHPKKFIVKVACGSETSDKAVENVAWFRKVKANGYDIVEHSFNSMSEVEAFITGLELGAGWMEEAHMIL